MKTEDVSVSAVPLCAAADHMSCATCEHDLSIHQAQREVFLGQSFITITCRECPGGICPDEDQ